MNKFKVPANVVSLRILGFSNGKHYNWIKGGEIDIIDIANDTQLHINTYTKTCMCGGSEEKYIVIYKDGEIYFL